MEQVIHRIGISAISSGHVFSFVCLFTAIYRNTFGSNSTICHQFRGNSVLVNERDGGGNVSITAGLVPNELHMYLLCVCVCVAACVVHVHKCWRGRNRDTIKKKKKIQCLYDNVSV